MLIFPAIDLFEGKAVRLYKGNYDEMTVYNEDPPAAAEWFAECGAEWAHIVDLEGAREGKPMNLGVIEKIAAKTRLKCEVGGGVRSEETVKRYLDAGVSRVILGTAAVNDRELLKKLCAKYGKSVAVGVDIREGQVAVKGWTQLSGIGYDDFCRELSALGVSTLICTDISRDGAMRGTNAALYKELNEKYGFELIASGGVSSMEDIAALRSMELYGAIIGKALYTGDIDLREAIRAAR